MEVNTQRAIAQQIFDKVCTHLLNQGEKCKEGPRCVFKNSKGLKCAVGALIPDEQYHSYLELNGIYSLIYRGIVPDMFPLLEDLRMVHDHTDAEAWRYFLKLVADKHDLVMK